MTGDPSRRPPAGWLPHPRLALLLAVLWLLLQNRFTVGGLLVGLVLGVVIAHATRSFWPQRPHVRACGKVFAYLLRVFRDILVANLAVARLILFRPAARLEPCWIVVPLDLEWPEAIAVFAATITLTPGTVSCDLSADRRTLLVHCLDAPDPEAIVRILKERYEAPLKEIFE
ncbi:Na+/H+ antiporter subunit E [Azoarcus sp. PA01]|nr:Na+/H+ antiporter subunit E [Azoarcus sp. PA01]